MVWNIVMIFLISYTATVMPYRQAFSDDYVDHPFFDALDLVIDILFWIDIVINFISAYEKYEGVYEYRLKKIAKNYLLGYFALDFVATFPFGSVLSAGGEGEEGSGTRGNTYLRLIRLNRFYKLLRILRLAKMVNMNTF